MQPASRVRFATRMVCRKGQFPVERDSSPQSTLWYTTVSALQKADDWLSIINTAATRCRNWQKSDVTEHKRSRFNGFIAAQANKAISRKPCTDVQGSAQHR
ncbi:MAG: hypothetical protein GY820_44410 [Gammaproteobacteria bacterium]|nr:hypothetical protein [Gammaproteobacteria bacterium]